MNSMLAGLLFQEEVEIQNFIGKALILKNVFN